MAINDKPKKTAAQILAEIQANKAAKAGNASNAPSVPSVATPAPAPKQATPASSAAQLLAKLKADKEAKLKTERETEPKAQPPKQTRLDLTIPAPAKLAEHAARQESTNTGITGMHGEVITYNTEQQKFVDTVAAGKSCVLIGAAGTGKTTATQGAIRALLANNSFPTLNAAGHPHLQTGSPGIVILSFTRRAVNNIRKVQSEDMKSNCITAHKLLNYQPVFYEKLDPETGDLKKTMSFEPSYNEDNPLPNTISVIVVEEASMLGVDLYTKIINALSHEVIWIFIGDIQQLPPVFGPAILGFKMLELPVIELTQVYRQALESPIIRLAHRVLSGKPLPATEFQEWKVPNQLTIHPWKKKLKEDSTVLTLAHFFKSAIDTLNYPPEDDCILLPFNKGVGTIELNKHIANFLARKRNATTYEIQAGFEKHYFSVGDRILCDKEDATIIDISPNKGYTGSKVQPPSKTLDYWGHNPNIANEGPQCADYSDADIDLLLDAVATNSEDRVNQASHVVKVTLEETGRELELRTAGDINSLLHGYAITVHKAQGSEWRKVFLILHHTHATMLQRELLYTGITRAREELYIICEPESLVNGIKRQKIKGNTIEDKAQFFKGKLEQLDKTNQLLDQIADKSK